LSVDGVAVMLCFSCKSVYCVMFGKFNYYCFSLSFLLCSYVIHVNYYRAVHSVFVICSAK
jgi:hypothetical protein